MSQVQLDRDEAEEGDLPRVCIRCGARAVRFERRKFLWYPVWARPVPLLRMTFSRTATVTLPLCRAHAGQLDIWWFGPGLWGLRPTLITHEQIILAGVAEEFLDALEDYRANGESRPAAEDEADCEPYPRRPRGSATALKPARSSGSVLLWLLLGGFLVLPLLACGIAGLAFVLLLWLPRPPAGPVPALPGAQASAAPGPADIAAAASTLAACPPTGFPGGVPWTGLAVMGDGFRWLRDQQELDGILAALRAGDVFTSGDAARRLARLPPAEPRRAEVVRSLEPLLTNPFPDVREAAARALVVWGTSASVPALIKLLENEPFPHVRAATLEALAALKEPRAFEPVARRLTDFSDRARARQTLESFGPAAEQAVLPYVTNPDRQVRIEACRVLAVIGTKASVPVLQAAARDTDPEIAQAAQAALRAVAARP
jgi:hypothetical protein